MFHSEVVDLPSRGWFYPPDHPLATGQISIFNMTAKHEDILTSTNLIMKGVVVDKLIEALIATDGVKCSDLLIGDKYAVMVAARILGYGKDYEATIECPQCGANVLTHIDLEKLGDKDIIFNPAQKGRNEFTFELPFSKNVITFKLLTQKDDQAVRKELDAMKKIQGDTTQEVTTRMRNSILSVDGDRDKETIRKFIMDMPARDARAFREYAKKVMPDIDMTFEFECSTCGKEDRLEVPITEKFFWPDSRV